jgi:hypothetical protein
MAALNADLGGTFSSVSLNNNGLCASANLGYTIMIGSHKMRRKSQNEQYKSKN